jgi:exodeoxyribonuclease VII large subunit
MALNSKSHLSLYEVSQRVKESLESSFPSRIWVVAEIGELKENRSGHCYLELVEKDEGNDQPKAKARAIIWSWSYRMIKPFFETSTGRKLAAGIKILVLCDITYHPVYGFSLSIQDIEPTFTIGDIEQKRQQTIDTLIADGVFDMNKEVGFPLLPKRIAVISSATAAGYQDFTHQIDNNLQGYKIYYQLFKAIMQGEKAEETIIEALNQIHLSLDSWDVVAIIRGGGSQVDLGCFDGYQLASNVAQFPIPIITGIGHEKDVTITDMVAYTRLKTPTAVAEFLIGQFSNAENWILEAIDNFTDSVKEVVSHEAQFISSTQSRTAPLIMRTINSENIKLQRQVMKGQEMVNRYISAAEYGLQGHLNELGIRLPAKVEKQHLQLKQLSKSILSRPQTNLNIAHERLNLLAKNAAALNPEIILNRGFSITLVNGKVLKNSQEVESGDNVETILASGKLFSKVTSVTKSKDKLA